MQLRSPYRGLSGLLSKNVGRMIGTILCYHLRKVKEQKILGRQMDSVKVQYPVGLYVYKQKQFTKSSPRL